ncbi:restriction endonuclease subunit S [Metapseudomonas otitidis]|uniref:restriction endonuclease subunit S n=1 Tax=Metapseudomonas otitidis TaxID=319939 RepID=UPI0013F64895|nr:restriction endonuclease subunit S [Pseudomonas otitidis]
MTGFPIVFLKDIAHIEREIVQAANIEAGERYVGLENINSRGIVCGVVEAAAGQIASAKFRFTADHILYGKLRPYLSKIALPDFSGVCSTDILPLKPTELVDKRYLWHCLRQPSLVELANSRATGANLPRLSPKQLEDFEVPLPKLAEQKRIAAILDKADALRAKRRKALEQLDALAQAVFIEMFSTATAQGWKEVPIELLASQEPGAIRTGPFGSQLLHSEFTDEGVAVLGIDNAVQNEFAWGESRYVSMEKYKQLSRYTVKPGDVIITIMGTCGRCAVVPQNIPLAINTKHLCCITLDQAKCLPDFLHAYFLRHPLARGYLERTAKGAIMSGLNMGLIKSMPVKLPPLELQAAFVRRIEGIRKQKAILRGHARQLDALFSSLQHRAFRGEL